MRSLRDERGSTTTEFVLVAPLLALAMMFLIGLGYTLMTKQNAIVGARTVVFYRITADGVPDANSLGDTVKDSVSPDREDWIVRDLGDTSLGNEPEVQGIGQSGPNLGAFGVIQGAINSLYQKVNHETGYQVSTTPTLGLLPRVLKLDRSVRPQSRYYLPRGTWTCEETEGGSYLTVAMSGIGAPSWVKRLFDPGCCRTYPATRGGGR